MKMDNEIILQMALEHAHKRLSQLEKQSKGLERDDVAATTVYKFCKERGLDLSLEQRITLGRMARNLSDVAGRPKRHSTNREVLGTKGKGYYKACLHTERALERCAESMGIKF